MSMVSEATTVGPGLGWEARTYTFTAAAGPT
jgi:hypothetical protein